jgi:hypothetical protein
MHQELQEKFVIMVVFVDEIFETFPGDFEACDVWEECWEGFEVGSRGQGFNG